MNKFQFAKLVSYISALRQVTLNEHDMWELDRLTTIEAPKVDLAHLFNAMAQGEKIEAIKAHRTLTGFGLKESKDEVERVMGRYSAIRDALNTDQTDAALVQLARNARKAEVKLAVLQRMVDTGSYSDERLGVEVKQLMKSD